VAVEGQVGEVGSSWAEEGEGRKTDPLEAQEFVQKTNIDLLLGGRSCESPSLHYERKVYRLTAFMGEFL
jgi:hypothetical protein